MTDALRVEHLCKRYGRHPAVDDLSFAVESGEIYGLLGPNGAGKTTTMEMISGVTTPDAGSVGVFGHILTPRRRDLRALLGVVPQDIALYPQLSARENLAFFGRLCGLHGRRLRERVSAALAAVGLSERAGDRLESYSGGMARRANIAVALLTQPRLLVLDEPTVGVDPHSRNAILEHLRGVAGDGRAVLLASHHMDEVARLADRVGILDAGRLIAEDSPRRLVERFGGEGRVVVRYEGPPGVETKLRRLPGVEAVRAGADGLEVVAHQPSALLPEVLGLLSRHRGQAREVRVTEPDLQAVFLRLTGRGLRD